MVSPDEGSIKRALGHAKRLGASWRSSTSGAADAEHTSQENIIGGPVEGKVALMFDDMISTAGSICGAAQVHPAARGPADLRRGHARRAVRPGDRAAQEIAHRRGRHHRHDSAAARADAPQDQGAERGPAAWAKRSSGFTATSRSAGCSTSVPPASFAPFRPFAIRPPGPASIGPPAGRRGFAGLERRPDSETMAGLSPGGTDQPVAAAAGRRAVQKTACGGRGRAIGAW